MASSPAGAHEHDAPEPSALSGASSSCWPEPPAAAAAHGGDGSDGDGDNDHACPLLDLVQRMPDLFAREVLARLPRTDRTMLAQVGHPWLAAVVASGGAFNQFPF